MVLRLWLVIVIAAWPTASSAVEVDFADLAAARLAIVDDHLEPYFSTLQPLEMAAKTGRAMAPGPLPGQQDECRRRYQEGVRAFSAEEQEAVTWYVERLDAAVAKDYPLVAETPWRFLKVSDDIEGGLPHTRGEYVVFAQGFLNHLTMARKQLSEQKAMQLLGDTVIHEHLHVVQRLHPDRFVGLYTDLWHLRRAPNITSCAWLVEHNLSNPDGVDCGWVFPVTRNGETRWIWPLVIFADVEGIGRMPDDFVMAAIPLSEAKGEFTVVADASGKPAYTDLLAVPEYVGTFAGSRNIYHPNESAADLFAKIVILDSFTDRKAVPAQRLAALEQKYQPLRVWFKANFAAAAAHQGNAP